MKLADLHKHYIDSTPIVETISDEELNEISFKGALASGILGASMLSPISSTAADKMHGQQTHQVQKAPQQKQQIKAPVKKMSKDERFALHKTTLATKIAKHYRVDNEIAKEAVDLAYKYARPDFPTAMDILSIIGTESSFNPESVSGLKNDPAIGFMQVRPGIWGINPEDLYDSHDNQVRYGAKILNNYFKKLKDKSAAIQAYNLGITNFNKGKETPAYLAKYSNSRDTLAKL